MTIEVNSRVRRHWFRLAWRIIGLLWSQQQRTSELVCLSYDRIAGDYDDIWTHHMREFSLSMIDRLAPPVGARCLDLACGTGFITGELARRTNGQVTGVDASAGMLEIARRVYGNNSTFIQCDVIQYLRSCANRSVDVITCGWGLGYTRPLDVVGEAARVLCPGGRMGIIDNSLFSLAEVLWSSILVFAERPEALRHVMRVRFLPASFVLAFMMRMCGFGILNACDGFKTYYVSDGQAAIDRLRSTGAAAGFEFASHDDDQESVFARFAEVLERRYRVNKSIPVTHRYLAVIGRKR